MEIKAFVTNLGKYNEGYLIGEWVTFPITDEEREDLFQRIGISDKPDKYGQIYEEIFMSDYDSELDLYSIFGEYPRINTLNELAEQIDELSDYESDVLEAILESGAESDVFRALDNLDNYGLCYNVTGPEYEERLIEDCYPELDFSHLGWLSSYIDIDYDQMWRDEDRAYEVGGNVLYEY